MAVKLLSIDDLAQRLQVPKATLYAWRSRGTGPKGFRVGVQVRYRETDVERWIEQQLANDRTGGRR